MIKKRDRISRLVLVFFIVSIQMVVPVPVQASLQAWEPVNGPMTPGGIVTDLAQSQSDPNTLFALVEGLNGDRLYRSSDRSDHWTMVYQFNVNDMTDLAVDPGNSNVVYIGGSTGLLRSTDGGNQWELFNTSGLHLAVPAPNTIFTVGKTDQKPASCSSDEFTFTWSTDGGENWNTSDLGCFYTVDQVKVLNSQLNTIYIMAMKATGGNPWDVERLLLKSQDGGQTWQFYVMPSEWRCPLCGDLVIDPLNPQHLYSSLDALLLFSLDGGQTWDINSNYSLGINCDWGCTLRLAVAGNSLYAIPLSGLSQPVFRSQDGGASWWQSPDILPAGAFALVADSSLPERLFVGLVGYGVYRTDDAGGSRWIEANQGIQTPARLTALAVAPSNPQVIFAASDYPRRALFSTQDGGQAWSLPLLDNEYDGPFRQPGKQGVRILKITVHPKDPTQAWVGGDYFYAYQKGPGWYRLSNTEISDLKVSPSFPDYPFAAAGNGIAFRAPSTIGPPGYLPWYFNYVNNLYPTALAIDPSQPNHILIASNFTTSSMGIAIDIYSTVDDGLTYQKLSEIPADNMIENLEISPSDAQMVIATTKDARGISHWALISHDGGKSWTPWSEGLTGGGGWDSFLAVDSNSIVYYGGEDGVYSRSQNNPAWLSIGLQDQTIRSMALSQNNPKFLLAATDQGLFKLNLAPYSLWLPFVTQH